MSTPYYYPYSEEALIKHYETVCRAVDLPVLVYNIPQRTGVNVDAVLMEKTAKINGIAGIKDNSKDIEQMEEYVKRLKGKISLLQGMDTLIYAGLVLGADGCVSAASNVVPEIVVGVYNSFIEGKLEKAMELQLKLFSIRKAIAIDTPMSGIKEAMNLRGFKGSCPRAPSLPLKPEEREGIRRELDLLGLI